MLHRVRDLLRRADDQTVRAAVAGDDVAHGQRPIARKRKGRLHEAPRAHIGVDLWQEALRNGLIEFKIAGIETQLSREDRQDRFFAGEFVEFLASPPRFGYGSTPR